ncbi:hypothetical protein ABK046_33705 [Streptomyces caeruleatus]
MSKSAAAAAAAAATTAVEESTEIPEVLVVAEDVENDDPYVP